MPLSCFANFDAKQSILPGADSRSRDKFILFQIFYLLLIVNGKVHNAVVGGRVKQEVDRLLP